MGLRTLLIDNYDSYSFNLFQLIAEVNGSEPIAVRNDDHDLPPLGELGVDNVVISPGPGRPSEPGDFGICAAVLREAALPVLGVCLGHQGIGWLYGGKVVPAPVVMHGRRSRITHTEAGLFAGIPQAFAAVRYHSLIVADEGAEELERIAWSDDGLCMGLRHRNRPLWGVQFHPESILTEHGTQLLRNFAELTRVSRRTWTPPPAEDRGAARSVVPHGRAEPPAARVAAAVRIQHRRLRGWVDPAHVFAHTFADREHAFWLDSALAEEGRARFSFMGAFPGGPLSERVLAVVGEPVRVQRPDGTWSGSDARDVFEHVDVRLRSLDAEGSGLPFDFHGGYVGYLGYELKALCGAEQAHASEIPDAQLLLADRFVAFDHARRELWVVGLHEPRAGDDTPAWVDATARHLQSLDDAEPEPEPEPARGPAGPPLTFELARDHDRYVEDIGACHRLLAAGETYEVCLTNRLTAETSADPLEVYAALRALNPAPFAALLRLGGTSVLSSSPERFLRIGPDRWIEAKPIKGTAARADEPGEDERRRDELEHSDKDRAENLMIVDLLRNDLGEVCEVGTVEVPALMEIESYETVHQMVTTIRGRLRKDLRPVDCVRAAFPGGSMTGAPKRRTMEILDELEGESRGVYSGSIGYLSVSGAVDLNIVIRTIVQHGREASIGAGGAIVIASDPEEEFDEMLLKARAPMEAVAAAAGRDGRPRPYTVRGDRRHELRPA